MTLRTQGIDAPDGFAGDGFVVRPLRPSDNPIDHEAVMSTREFLYHWEQEPPYPAEDFSLEENLEDLEQMATAHDDGIRYTFTVMNADETQALGCLYFFPNDDRMFPSAVVTSHDGTDFGSVDLVMAFWVRASTWDDGFEAVLLEAVLEWIRTDWSVSSPVVMTNEALEHQIASIESVGLVRAFDYDRDKDMYTNLVYR
ncbi:MAG: hypothetical protein AAGA90_11345 [Actinomycetota bacterium]